MYTSCANFSSSNITLGDFIITSGAFQGYSVNQFLQSANNFIGGCGTAKSSTTEFSASDYNATATAINENFDGGSIERYRASFFDLLFNETKLVYPKVSSIFKRLRDRYLLDAKDEDGQALLSSLE